MGKKLLIIFLMVPVLLRGQEERKYIRAGYKAYMDQDYTSAEVDFRKAEDVGNNDFIARYNTSAALYQQEKLEESGKRFAELANETDNPAERAKLLHNLGNVMLRGEQYQEAVKAYQQSLRLNPDDEDTRYNLAYALEKLREQQNKDQQNKDQQNKDQQKQDQQQDGQNKQGQQDQQKQEQDQQQQDQEQEQKQQQQTQEQEDQEQQQMQQAGKQELSKEEAERLLNAILQKEKNVKEKVDKQKARAAKVKTDKDW